LGVARGGLRPTRRALGALFTRGVRSQRSVLAVVVWRGGSFALFPALLGLGRASEPPLISRVFGNKRWACPEIFFWFWRFLGGEALVLAQAEPPKNKPNPKNKNVKKNGAA